MTKLNQILAALAVSFTTYLAGTASASAISLNLNWTGTGADPTDIYSLTGSFTGTDLNSNGFIRSIETGEITDFTLNFFKNSAPLVSYNSATILNDGQFNFNYEIVTNTILQTGNLADPTGFSIGAPNSSGYSLDSFDGSTLNFNDNTGGSDFASGGTLTATPVPFEFEGSAGILTIGAIWGINKWRKNRIKN